MEKANLEPVKKPSAEKRWIILHGEQGYDPPTHYALKMAQDDVKSLRDCGVQGPIYIFELVEIHRER